MVFSLLVILLWIVNGFFLDNIIGITTSEQDIRYGLFGDRFGAVNALFSGLAFAGVIYTLILQSEELQLQRKANADTRMELELQNEYNRKREIQTTFFDMLRLFQDTIDQIAVANNQPSAFNELEPTGVIHGRAALTLLCRRLTTDLHNTITVTTITDTNKSDEEMRQLIDCQFEEFHKRHDSLLGHYFRMLYQIVRYTHECDLSNDSDRATYIRVIRAYLSRPEMILLFYNCLSRYGHGKFHPLVEKYDLLQNLRREVIPKRYWDLYPLTRDRPVDYASESHLELYDA